MAIVYIDSNFFFFSARTSRPTKATFYSTKLAGKYCSLIDPSIGPREIQYGTKCLGFRYT